MAAQPKFTISMYFLAKTNSCLGKTQPYWGDTPSLHRASLHTPREQAGKATCLMVTSMLRRVGGYVKASPWYTATSLHSNLTLPYLTLPYLTLP